jgi:hypothetical protein
MHLQRPDTLVRLHQVADTKRALSSPLDHLRPDYPQRPDAFWPVGVILFSLYGFLCEMKSINKMKKNVKN